MKYGDLVHFGRISKNDFVEVSDRIHLQNEEERIKILICGTRSFNRNMCDIAHTVFNVGDKNVVLFEWIFGNKLKYKTDFVCVAIICIYIQQPCNKILS